MGDESSENTSLEIEVVPGDVRVIKLEGDPTVAEILNRVKEILSLDGSETPIELCIDRFGTPLVQERPACYEVEVASSGSQSVAIESGLKIGEDTPLIQYFNALRHELHPEHFSRGSVELLDTKVELESGRSISVHFHKSMRVPVDDGKVYDVPDISVYEMHSVKKFADRIPEEWDADKDKMILMKQAESMWIAILSQYGEGTDTFAIRVSSNGNDVVTGEEWASGKLDGEPQNFVSASRQAGINGFNPGNGSLHQFVAAPMQPNSERIESIDLEFEAYPAIEENIYFEASPHFRGGEALMFSTSSHLRQTPRELGISHGEKLYLMSCAMPARRPVRLSELARDLTDRKFLADQRHSRARFLACGVGVSTDVEAEEKELVDRAATGDAPALRLSVDQSKEFLGSYFRNKLGSGQFVVLQHNLESKAVEIQPDVNVTWSFLEEKGRDLFGADVRFTPADVDHTSSAAVNGAFLPSQTSGLRRIELKSASSGGGGASQNRSYVVHAEDTTKQLEDMLRSLHGSDSYFFSRPGEPRPLNPDERTFGELGLLHGDTLHANARLSGGGFSPVMRHADSLRAGNLRQAVVPDPSLGRIYDTTRPLSFTVHLVNSDQWQRITGKRAPPPWLPEQRFVAAGIPYLDLYNDRPQRR